jgi:hypothetical protein
MVGIRTSMHNATHKILHRPVAIAAIAALFACLCSSAVIAQKPNVAPSTATTQAIAPPVPSKSAKKPDVKPTWNELTPAQQHALAPLAGEWNKMESNRKEKWLAIGNKFSGMNQAEQDRVQERMREWLKLTPAQRRSVRESYTRAKKLDADKKSAQWKQYQQLSEEQKKKLAQAKLPKHVAALPATRSKAAPTIQLPSEALEQTLVPAAPVAAPAPVPASTPAETK